MTSRTGVVSNTGNRDVNTQRGPMKAYWIHIEGEQFPGGAGWKDLHLTPGDTISFDVETTIKGDKTYENYKNIKRIGVSETQATYVHPDEVTSQTQTPPASAATATPAHVDKRQQNIMYQSSRKDAVETMKILYDANAVPNMPEGSPAEKYDHIMTVIKTITESYYENVINFEPLQ